MQNLIKILFPYSLMKSSLLVWTVLTMIYLGFAFIAKWGPPESVLPTLLGLFVPYGFWNIALSFESHIALYLLVLFPFVLLSLDAFFARFYIMSPRHYIFTLLFLLSWTLLVDLVIWDRYQSLYLFLEAVGFDVDAVPM